MISNQTIFDAVVTYLRFQPERSIDKENGITCLYRGNNNRCAAGIFIKDKDYSEGLERRGISDFNYDNVVARLFKDNGFNYDNLVLLNSLQKIHDHIKRDGIERSLFEETSLLFTAAKFGLNSDFIV